MDNEQFGFKKCKTFRHPGAALNGFRFNARFYRQQRASTTAIFAVGVFGFDELLSVPNFRPDILGNVTYVEPLLPLFLIIGLAGLVRLRSTSAPRRKLAPVAVCIIGILLLSWQPAAWLMTQPLQRWYEPIPTPREDAPVIVVLSGSVDEPNDERPYFVVGPDTYVRLRHAAWLYKSWHARPVLACGGKVANSMREVLESEGVPHDAIWIETHSRSTRENAVNCHEILHQHGFGRIALVTNASSMLRAAASFRKLGDEVIPAPCCFNHVVTDWGLLPSWSSIQLNGETIHEVVGLLWYRLRGWI